MAAELTTVNFAVSDTVVRGNLLTLRAKDTFRPTGILEKFKARIIGRELYFKVFNSIGFHFFSPIALCTYTIS
jgi:hypothetical protein